MLNPLDDTLAQKVILLMTGVPGTVAMRDEVSRLIKAGNPNELSVFVDKVMDIIAQGKDGEAAVQYVLDSGFSLSLTPQKIDQITADSLRQGVDSWTGLFSYAMDKVDNNVGKILGNRAEAADVFTGIVDELDVDVNVNHPLVQEWIDKINASDESLSEAKDTVKDLIDELTTLPVLVDSNPSDDSTDIAIGQDIVLTFNKKVTAGSGDIVIVGSDGDKRTIAVTDSSQVTITGKTLTLNPKEDLHKNTDYSVQLTSGVIMDLVDHAFAGISDTTTLNFRTVGVPIPTPTPDTTSPVIIGDKSFSYVESIFDHAKSLVIGKITTTADVIGTIVATDVSPITSYAIVTGNDEGYFAIDENGRLTLTAAGLFGIDGPYYYSASPAINYEIRPNSFNLTITATDSAGNTSSGDVFTINVDNNPDDDGTTLMLTTLADSLAGSDGPDLFLGYRGEEGEDTLQNSDFIDGSFDWDFADFELSGFGIVAPTIQNVEFIGVSTDNEEGATLDMSNISGVQVLQQNAGSLSFTNVGTFINYLTLNDIFSSSDVTVNYSDAALVLPSDFMIIQLESNSDGRVDSVVTINNTESGTVEALAINSSFSTNDNITLTGSALTATRSLSINGPSNLHLSADGLDGSFSESDVLSVNSSFSTGNNVLDFSNIKSDLSLTGGSGDDTLIAGQGADILIGGEGADIMKGYSSSDEITDTFIVSAKDSLNTSLDLIDLEFNDILDLAVDITSTSSTSGADFTEVIDVFSTGTTAATLAADIETAVNAATDNAFDQIGDTIEFFLSGDSVAGTNIRYVVQNQGNNSTYDTAEDTVIALQGISFFSSDFILDGGNLQLG